MDRMFTNLLTNNIQTNTNAGALTPPEKPVVPVSDLSQILGVHSSSLPFRETLNRIHFSQTWKTAGKSAFELSQTVRMSPRVSQKITRLVEQILSGNRGWEENQADFPLPGKLVIAVVNRDQVSFYPYRVEMKESGISPLQNGKEGYLPNKLKVKEGIISTPFLSGKQNFRVISEPANLAAMPLAEDRPLILLPGEFAPLQNVGWQNIGRKAGEPAGVPIGANPPTASSSGVQPIPSTEFAITPPEHSGNDMLQSKLSAVVPDRSVVTEQVFSSAETLPGSSAEGFRYFPGPAVEKRLSGNTHYTDAVTPGKVNVSAGSTNSTRPVNPKEMPSISLPSDGKNDSEPVPVIVRLNLVNSEMPPVASDNGATEKNTLPFLAGREMPAQVANPVTPEAKSGGAGSELPREFLLTAVSKEGEVLVRLRLIREGSETGRIPTPAENRPSAAMPELQADSQGSAEVRLPGGGNGRLTHPMFQQVTGSADGTPSLFILTDAEIPPVFRSTRPVSGQAVDAEVPISTNVRVGFPTGEKASHLSAQITRSGALEFRETEHPRSGERENPAPEISKKSGKKRPVAGGKTHRSGFTGTTSSEPTPRIPADGQPESGHLPGNTFHSGENNQQPRSAPAKEMPGEFRTEMPETTDGGILPEQEGNPNVHRKTFRRLLDSFGSLNRTKPNRTGFVAQKSAGSKLVKSPLEFVQSLAREIKFSFNNSNREIFIRLKPETLGSVFIRLKMKDDRLSGRVEVSSSEVYQTLVTHRQELNQRLQELNLRFDELDFGLLPEESSHPGQREAGDARTAGKSGNGFSSLPKSGIEEGDERMPGRRMFHYSTFEYIA